VDLADLGPARQGWHWYRRLVNFGPDQRELRLLIAGGDGTYELFVNGIQVPGPTLRSSLLVSRPVEAVFPISDSKGIFEIALRTRIPPGYSAWHLAQFTNVTVGLPTALEYERQALASQRLDGLAPSICINLLLCLAGVTALALYAIQQTQREYIFLGLYLLLVGISNGLSMLQSSGLVPLSANFLIADPLIYVWVIAQIEFTYSFAGRRVGRIWRIYEASLLVLLMLAVLTWVGLFASDTYVLIEAAATAPVGLLLSALLFVWYRQGNREAGWLILPSLAPAVSTALFDLGTASITLGWQSFNFLVEPIQMGPIALQLVDIGTLVFLLSIAVVMFFRLSRVTREQARAAAELAAAREIQQMLLPRTLPQLPGVQIAGAWQPAREVGGELLRRDSTGQRSPRHLHGRCRRKRNHRRVAHGESPGILSRFRHHRGIASGGLYQTEQVPLCKHRFGKVCNFLLRGARRRRTHAHLRECRTLTRTSVAEQRHNRNFARRRSSAGCAA
jgi:hypothetical protein